MELYIYSNFKSFIIQVLSLRDSKVDSWDLGQQLFQNSTFYKRITLYSLELVFSLNFVLCIGFLFYIFPNSSTLYQQSSLTYSFGDTFYVQMYFIIRNVIINIIPALCTVLNILSSDIVFIEVDWWLFPLISVIYLIANNLVTQYSGLTQVYVIDWSVSDQNTYSYVPLIEIFAFMILLVSIHLLTCMLTQFLRQRFLSDIQNSN